MKLNKIFILLFSVIFNEVLALNILGVFPYEGKSHFFVFKLYLEELSKRGHNVTVISYFPQKQPLPNYKDISLAGKSEILEEVFSIHRSLWSVIQIFIFLTSTGNKNCKILLEDENVQELWKNGVKFDVVVTEQFNSDCALGLAHVLKAPVVGITSNALMPWYFSRFGIDHNPSYVSAMMLEGGTKPTLYQRVERYIIDAFSNMLYRYGQRNDRTTLGNYFNDIPPLEVLGQNVKFLLLYTNFVLNGVMLYPPNIIEVGGHHVPKAKSVPSDIKKFIEESEHGVIYISFGSMLRAASTPQDKIEAIVGAISKLPQRFIWKWEGSTLPGNPKNVFLSNWLPQNDILAHPNVIAFYSHCGLLGTTEAMHHGVPMICMPVFGDQPGNAASVAESGLGVQIQVHELDTPTLLEKFKIILNPEFRSKVKEISKMWHDRPMSAMDSAIYWTEFAARTSNVTFRSAATTVPTYQYFYIDILTVLTGITVILVASIRLVLKMVCSKSKQTQKKVKSK